MTKLIQIVPTLPPLVGGVGDYAHCLAIQLTQRFHLPTHFLVSDQTWDNNVQELHYTVSNSLLKLLNTHLGSGSTVLLHYVGYGYAKRGCPIWLVEALSEWKARYPEARLITMFHEVAASGPPWTSAFWLSGMQKHLAKRLVQISDRIITSKRSYAEILQRYAPGRFEAIPTLPVFSNIGELQNPSSLLERTRRLVIFGGRSKRSKVYRDCLEQLHQICRHLKIQQIYDIGPPLDSLPTHIDTVSITLTGCLPSAEVSAILADSIAGFFSYHPAFLGKSSIFAAYCAHHVLPVSASMSDFTEEDLHPGKHYFLPAQYNREESDIELMQTITDNAYAWYQTHNLSRQALVFFDIIRSISV